MDFIYVLLAIFIFGFLILIHEAGHFFFARLFRVTVNEFAIGMGPKVVSYTSKKSGIAYSLRLLPFGGFVSMAGEDEESDDPGALCAKPVWQRIIITAAGAAMNLLVGFLVMTVLVSFSTFGGTVVADFFEGATSPSYGLQVEDRIVMIDHTRVHTATDLVYTIMHDARGPVDVTVERDGQMLVLNDVQFPTSMCMLSKKHRCRLPIRHSGSRSIPCR